MVEFHLQKQKVCIFSMAEMSVAVMSIGRNVRGRIVCGRKVLAETSMAEMSVAEMSEHPSFKPYYCINQGILSLTSCCFTAFICACYQAPLKHVLI